MNLSMRRIVLSLLALAAFIPAFSQNNVDWSSITQDLKDQVKDAIEDDDDEGYSPVIAQSSDGQFKLFTSSYVGYSLYFVRSNDYASSLSGEFFVNILGGGFYPTENLGFEIKVDFGHNALRSRESVFFLDSDREVCALDRKLFYTSDVSKPSSSLTFLSVNLPFQVKYTTGDFRFGLGTELGINFRGHANQKYSQGQDSFDITQKGAKINLFTYALLGTIQYDKVTLFLKYYPRPAGILAGHNLEMGYASLGLAFGM